MPNNDENFKFWMRRILALVVSVPAISILSYLAMQGNETALGAVIGWGASIVSYYFGQRSIT